MLLKLSESLEIDSDLFEKHQILDSILGVDTPLFLDPHLLKNTKIPEFEYSKFKISDYFTSIIHILIAFKRSGSRKAFNTAIRKLSFKEIPNVSIGYGKDTTNGNAIGKTLAKKLVNSGLEILGMGIEDPEMFELLGLFEDGFGADRLSDMTIAIILEDILNYTEKMTTILEIHTKKVKILKYKEREYSVPMNLNSGKALLLLPKSLLRDLPVALDREGIDKVVSVNQELRDRLNSLIGKAWNDKIKKSDLRKILFSDKEALKSLIAVYKNSNHSHYNYNDDPEGITTWYDKGKEAAKDNPLIINIGSNTLEELEKAVDSIVKQFKKLIENNGINKLLYSSAGKPKHERYSQLLFFAIADAYCAANNIDISPEVNSGNGALDFKFSRGYYLKIAVEIKLNSNNQLAHGFNVQLPTYQKSENSRLGYYIIIQVKDSTKLIEKVLKLKNETLLENKVTPKIEVIDARLKFSASKR